MLGPRSRAPETLAFAALVGLLLGLLGCAAENSPPELLNVVDVAPREVDVGDRVEVLGVNLPTGEAKEAQVIFRGELRRPGQAPLTGQEIVIDRAVVSADKIAMPFTEGLQSRFCGRGDEAAHTTFRGDVTVKLRAARGAVVGTVKGVTVGFRSPSLRRAVVEARAKEGTRALAFLGLAVSPDALPAGGLLVIEVASGSPASRAQLLPGDVIVSFQGARVASVADMVPTGAERLPAIAVKRGDQAPIDRKISLEGYDMHAPADLLGAGLILVIAAGIILLFTAPTARILTWVERRVAARFRSRGVLVGLADGIKSIPRKDIGPLVRFAPYLGFAGFSATFAGVAFGQHLVAGGLDVGILFLVVVTSLVTIGLLTGGWSANQKWSILGGVRSAAQILSYEIPGVIAIVCLVMMTGSLRMQDIIGAQGGPGGSVLATGGWPWSWYAFRTPVTFALFLLYFTAALAERDRGSSDLPEAESELLAGCSTERSGMRCLLFLFAEWANVVAMSGLASALFLGGWQIPGVSPTQQEAHLGLQLLGALIFLAKSWGLIFVVVWVKWTLPRIRVEQMMNLCWKWFVPASFVAFAVTAALTVLPVDATLQLVISLATFGTWGLLTAHFVRRVRHNVRESRVAVHLNPFL